MTTIIINDELKLSKKRFNTAIEAGYFLIWYSIKNQKAKWQELLIDNKAKKSYISYKESKEKWVEAFSFIDSILK